MMGLGVGKSDAFAMLFYDRNSTRVRKSCVVLQHPMRQTDDLIFKDRVVVIKTALIGVGPTCRGFPWCRPK